MGCASSKEKVCRHCRAPYSPVRRSYSMHVHVHHPPQTQGDSYHLVALTSSTLGSLKLDDFPLNKNQGVIEEKVQVIENRETNKEKKGKDNEFAMGMIEAKTWSQMINEKIPKVVPKTPIMTPPGEPETINTWELMEGLEDVSPLRPIHHLKSFSFHVGQDPSLYSRDNEEQATPKVKENGDFSPKPLWQELADNDSNSISNDSSIVSEFDPEVIATFRKALEELPPASPFHLKPLEGDKQPARESKDQKMEITDEKDAVNGFVTEDKIAPPGKDKVVVYFTSLRGVRKTFEDCCHVRLILKALRVKVDERDVSMHSGFKEELKELLGEGFTGGGLPRVFIGRKYIGGAEEIRRLHEDGQLEKLLKGYELAEDSVGGGGNGVCEACGDIRFVPCETCSGSCKIYYDDDYEECDETEHEYGFHRCPDCNENGLIRCPICCD